MQSRLYMKFNNRKRNSDKKICLRNDSFEVQSKKLANMLLIASSKSKWSLRNFKRLGVLSEFGERVLIIHQHPEELC